MTKTTTPKRVLEGIPRDSLRSPPFRLFQNPLQKVSFCTVMAAFGGMALFTLLFSRTQ